MLPAQMGVDIFGELERLIEEPHELATSKGVLDELARIAMGMSADAPCAKVALKIVDGKRVTIAESTEQVDEWLVREAEKGGAIVCTNDAELIKRLRRKRVRVVRVRGKSHLGFAD
jgi:rRNA-processing protein FCF1